jgi:hypothetical protein
VTLEEVSGEPVISARTFGKAFKDFLVDVERA